MSPYTTKNRDSLKTIALPARPYARYLRRIRIEIAHELLLHTNETIESIAGRTGFSDGSHLTKKYKAQYGKTPKQARKSARS